MKTRMITLTLVAVASVAFSACLPGQHNIYPPAGRIPHHPTTTTTEKPLPCPDGFALNEYGDCKLIEPPAPTTPAQTCPVPLNEFGDCKVFDAPQAPGPVNDNKTP